MPERAASLRLIGRFGLVLACAGAVVCVAAVAASARSEGQPPTSAPSRAATAGPGRLWSRFPLAARPSSSRPAASDARAREDSGRALVPAPPGVERPSRLRPVLVAAFGTSVFATALLLALLAVTASQSAAFHRFLATRRARPLDRALPLRDTSVRAYPPADAVVVADRPADASVPADEPAKSQVVASRHLAFVPTDAGYALLEVEGEPPRVGSWLSGSEFGLAGRFRVSKIGPSPLPADERRCVYLERS